MCLRHLLTNATLVMPDGLVPHGSILIENRKIAALGSADITGDSYAADCETVDLRGAYLLPGFIDLHTDTLEKEITPRPGADFPIEVAMQELDRKMIACGITTVFHSLHFGYEEAELANRSSYSRRTIVEAVNRSALFCLAKTKIHARYETVGKGVEAQSAVREFLDEGFFHLLSFMDHTPGQGQYTLSLFFDRQRKQGLTDEAAREILAIKQNRPKLSWEDLAGVSALARLLGIPVASHDDDSLEKVQRMHDIGVSICEFPINHEAAKAARGLGMEVFGGAANVLRGGSLTGNLKVLDGINAGTINGLCSDYYPPAMLHAVFKLWRERACPLHQAVQMATLAPARAARMDDHTGSLAVGKDADLLVVDLREDLPRVTQTFVRGERVYMAGRENALAAMA